MKRYKSIFQESQSVDIMWIAKRLSEYKKGIIDENDLVEGILVDLMGKNFENKVKEALRDHISNSVDEMKSKQDIIGLAKEIYRTFSR